MLVWKFQVLPAQILQLVKSVGSGQQKAIFEQLKQADEVLADSREYRNLSAIGRT